MRYEVTVSHGGLVNSFEVDGHSRKDAIRNANIEANRWHGKGVIDRLNVINVKPIGYKEVNK
jgi:hypothetical protein